MYRKVAATLREILYNPIVKVALDKSQPIKHVIDNTLKAWQVDLDKRSPAPAYKESLEGYPIYRGTDFDLFTFLMAIAQRKAVINIPSYAEIQPRELRSNQRIVSRKNRHGQVYRLVSCDEAHSFSVRIKDFNVVETKWDKTEREPRDVVGAFRHFMVVDYFGNWNKGWSKLEFRASEKERQFLEEHKLSGFSGINEDLDAEESVLFKNFVHPHLAMAFYGSRYIATKALANRVKDQACYYRNLAKYVRKMGIKLPPTSKKEEYMAIYKSAERTKGILVPNIQAKLVLPKMKGEYPIFSLTEDGKTEQYKKLPRSDRKAMQGVLRYSETVRDYLTYGIGTSIRAPVRAVELAYFLNGFYDKAEIGNERTPAWGIPEWIRDYRESGRRIKWNALQLTEGPGAFLMYRIRNKTLQVSFSYLLREPYSTSTVSEAVLV